jgi:hypothetical protein
MVGDFFSAALAIEHAHVPVSGRVLWHKLSKVQSTLYSTHT